MSSTEVLGTIPLRPSFSHPIGFVPASNAAVDCGNHPGRIFSAARRGRLPFAGARVGRHQSWFRGVGSKEKPKARGCHGAGSGTSRGGRILLPRPRSTGLVRRVISPWSSARPVSPSGPGRNRPTGRRQAPREENPRVGVGHSARDEGTAWSDAAEEDRIGGPDSTDGRRGVRAHVQASFEAVASDGDDACRPGQAGELLTVAAAPGGAGRLGAYFARRAAAPYEPSLSRGSRPRIDTTRPLGASAKLRHRASSR